jgi:hypothetical protein
VAQSVAGVTVPFTLAWRETGEEAPREWSLKEERGMRILVLAAVAALALGVTVKDMSTSSGAGPEDAWAERAEGVVSDDTQVQLTEKGEQAKQWLIDSLYGE